MITKMEPKSGKTTMASKFPKPLLLATEKGYNAISGIKAQPIDTWAQLKQVVRQLDNDEAREMFETVIVDTVKRGYDYGERY